jgi:hypothetical protein
VDGSGRLRILSPSLHKSVWDEHGWVACAIRDFDLFMAKKTNFFKSILEHPGKIQLALRRLDVDTEWYAAEKEKKMSPLLLCHLGLLPVSEEERCKKKCY